MQSFMPPGAVCAEQAAAFPLQGPSQSRIIPVANSALSHVSAPPYCAAMIHVRIRVF